MRAMIFIVCGLHVAATAFAQDLGARAPVKSPPAPVVNIRAAERQGGDTIESALLIPAIPFSDSGTTAGFTDDYDEVCPYADSTSPDVVYRLAPSNDTAIVIDLCGSSFDTKLYVYDSALQLIACNDDFYDYGDPCHGYTSRLDNVVLHGWQTYAIIIDGYGGDGGDYQLQIDVCANAILDCPAYGHPEGEPPLDDDYVDDWNGGCNTFGAPFQQLSGDWLGELVLCGVGGWYLYGGSNYRDTDWFIATMGPGTIEVLAAAEQPTYVFELWPQDCNTVDVRQQIEVGPCMAEATMTITGYPVASPVWLWVGSKVFATPPGCDNEYDYVLWISGLHPFLATTPTTWSTVKALYE